jgi:hypothetical protein
MDQLRCAADGSAIGIVHNIALRQGDGSCVPIRGQARRVLLWPRPQARGTVLPLEKSIRLEFLRRRGPSLLDPLVLSATLALSTPNFWIQSLSSP